MTDLNKTLDKLYYVVELTEKQQLQFIKALETFKSTDDVKVSILRHNPITGLQAPVIKKLSEEVRKELSNYPYEVYEGFFWMIYNMMKYPKKENKE